METKTFLFEVKADEDVEGKFSGYANTVELDKVDDIVEPSAFKKTVKEYNGKRGIFFMHKYDIDNYLGVADGLKVEKEKGLKMTGALDMDDKRGRKAYKGMVSGGISHMSVGFQIVKATFEKLGEKIVRHIRELKLSEISLCPPGMAANDGSVITNVKNLDDVWKYIIDNKNDSEFMDKLGSLVLTSKEPAKTTLEVETQPSDESMKLHHENILKILEGVI